MNFWIGLWLVVWFCVFTRDLLGVCEAYFVLVVCKGCNYGFPHEVFAVVGCGGGRERASSSGAFDKTFAFCEEIWIMFAYIMG